MKRLALSGICCLISCLTWAAEQSPNIIYIMADDLGYGDLSCFGQRKFETPNIDRIAAEGVMFTDYYSILAVSPDASPSEIRAANKARPEISPWRST